MEKENIVVEQKESEAFYTLSSVFPSKEINDMVMNIIREQKEVKPNYTLSSVFPSKEINDIVKDIIDEQNKTVVCQSIGLSQEEAKLLTWRQINELLENRKQCNNRQKVFQILRQGRKVN